MESTGIAGAERLDDVVSDNTLNIANTPIVNKMRCFFAVFCFSGSISWLLVAGRSLLVARDRRQH
jgi:hypothetical protein